MKLCENCMDRDESVRDVPIGWPGGTQRDPDYHYLALCEFCRDHLAAGDMGAFHDRYVNERLIRRG